MSYAIPLSLPLSNAVLKKVPPVVLTITAAGAAFVTAAWLMPQLRSEAPEVAETPPAIVAPTVSETPSIITEPVSIPKTEITPVPVRPVVITPTYHVVKHVHKRKWRRVARHKHVHHLQSAEPRTLTLFDFILLLLGSNPGR